MFEIVAPKLACVAQEPAHDDDAGKSGAAHLREDEDAAASAVVREPTTYLLQSFDYTSLSFPKALGSSIVGVRK